MDLVSMKIGMKVEELREKKELSQAVFAKMLGISRSSIINIETGRQGVLMTRLYDIAIALDVDVVELLPELNWYKNNRGKKFKRVVTIIYE